MIYFTPKSFEEISNSLNPIINFTILEFVILFSTLFFIFILVFSILPFNQIILRLRNNKKEARKRKKLLNQIMAQKEIENEVEEEMSKREFKS